jgi:predicted Zn-dependent protease
MNAEATRAGRTRGALGALLALALAACGTLQTDGSGPFVTTTALPPPAPRPENAAPRVPPSVARNFGGLYANPEIERRLQSIIARLGPASERPDLRYSVAVLNSPSINAFALPDGQLFVTRGLLAVANDEAEIAAVLAHEMAHVVARHAMQRMEASQNVLLGSRVLHAVTGDAQAGQNALVSGALTVASFSRQQELEADQLGIRNLHRAGFDPYGAARLLENMDRAAALRAAMLNQRSDNPESSFLATHPSTPERLALAVAGARQLAGPDVGARERDALLRALDGLTYGDDPQTGLVRGRTYVHPGFGFTFTAPDGFSLDNTSRAVVGVSRDGRAMRFDTIRVAPATSLAEALATSATADLAIDAVEAGQIGPLPAAFATGRSPGWAFRFALVRAGSEVYRFIFAARDLTPDDDAEFLRAARTFRRLTPQEVAAVRPQRLRVVTVASGDNVETLARRMAGEDRQMERFLALNGIDRTAQLRPGQRVKIVTE